MVIDSNLYRQIIMDHYQYPRNKGLAEAPNYRAVHLASESCIDDFHVQVLVENGVVNDVRYAGVGCTISTAALSILSELIKQQPLDQALNILTNYDLMIHEEAYDSELLAEAIAFANVSQQANRIKCATIGSNGLIQLLKEAYNGQK